MELCSYSIVSNLPSSMLFNVKIAAIHSDRSLPSKKFPTVVIKSAPLPKCSLSEEASSDISAQLDDEPNEAMPGDDALATEEVHIGPTIEEAPAADEVHVKPIANERVLQSLKYSLHFLYRLIRKLNSEHAYTILVYGGVALVPLWISSATVEAIDSIPMLPKTLEIIGLGFTMWFTYRYLMFKKNREELASKIEGFK